MLTEEDAIEILVAVGTCLSVGDSGPVSQLLEKYKQRITERDSKAEIDKNYREACWRAIKAQTGLYDVQAAERSQVTHVIPGICETRQPLTEAFLRLNLSKIYGDEK